MGIGQHERPNRGATDVWLTPLEIIKALGVFDLDPCGQAGHKTADRLITERGLDRPWFGRVWLNPPYSEVGRWVEKLNDEQYRSKVTGVALVFARTETKWAQSILPKATSVFFPSGRIRFLDKAGRPGKFTAGAPSMFLSFGERPDWLKIAPGWIAKR